MRELHIDVKNKIATYSTRGGAIVCGNNDYRIRFTFDEEWDEYPSKQVRFIWNDKYIDVVILGDTVPVPMLSQATSLTVGVYAGEKLYTTTPAKIPCLRSILCESDRAKEADYYEVNGTLEHRLPVIRPEDDAKILQAVNGFYELREAPDLTMNTEVVQEVLGKKVKPVEAKVDELNKTFTDAINELSANFAPPVKADTNLTGSTWILKDDIDVSRVFDYSVGFYSNGVNFNSLKLSSEYDTDDSSDESYMRLYYGIQTAYYFTESKNDGYWYDEKYKTLTFTGGKDATNPDLIDWLYANGTLQTIQVWAEINALQAIITGNTWRLYDTFDGNWTYFEKNFNFISNGDVFNKIVYTTYSDDEDYHWEIRYDKPDGSSVYVYNDELNWINTAYQTVFTIDNISLADIATKVIVEVSKDLTTANKTILGAINEINAKAGGLSAETEALRASYEEGGGKGSLVIPINIPVMLPGSDLIDIDLFGIDFNFVDKDVVFAGGKVSLKNWFVGKDLLSGANNEDGFLKTAKQTLFGAINEVKDFGDKLNNLVSDAKQGLQNIKDGVEEVGSAITSHGLKDEKKLKTRSKKTVDAINELETVLSGEDVNTTVTDLTNTTWVLKEDVDTTDASYDINFTSNGTQYSYLTKYVYDDGENGEWDYIKYGFTGDSVAVYCDHWYEQAHRTIAITGGIDVTNTDLINWLYANGELQRKKYLTHLQSKQDENLNTESKEIVSAINEVNSKVGTPIVTTTGTGSAYEATVEGITELKAGVSFIMIPHTNATTSSPTLKVNDCPAIQIYRNQSTGQSYTSVAKTILKEGRACRVMYDGKYWIAVDYTVPVSAELSGRVPVGYGGVPSTNADNKGKVLTTNESGTPEWQTPSNADIDTSNLATVDKIGEIYTNDGDVNIDVADDSGISWTNTFGIYDDNGETIKYGALYQDLPIVAGNGIEFEIDEENQKVKINATGGGSTDDSIVGTWVFKDEPTFEGIAYAVPYYFNFSDASGQSYSSIEFLNQDYGVSANFIKYCTEVFSNTAYASQPAAWLSGGWDGDHYKTITITEEPTDETFISWLKANAVKQADTSKAEMPQIRFVSMPCDGWFGDIDWYAVTGDQQDYRKQHNLKFTIEIVGGGALQVGDTIQICRMGKYGASESYQYGVGKHHPPKRKLRRLVEYTITEEDLKKRFITFDVAWDDKRAIKLFTKHAIWGVNDDTMYFRIRRPKGEINSGNNGGGMTVDAEFSNVVSVRRRTMNHSWYDEETGEDIKYCQIRIV